MASFLLLDDSIVLFLLLIKIVFVILSRLHMDRSSSALLSVEPLSSHFFFFNVKLFLLNVYMLRHDVISDLGDKPNVVDVIRELQSSIDADFTLSVGSMPQ